MLAEVARVLPDCGTAQEFQGKQISKSDPMCYCGTATVFTVIGKQQKQEARKSRATKERAGSNGKSSLQGRPQGRGLVVGKSACEREELSTKETNLWRAVGSPSRQLQEAALRCRAG